MPLALQSRARSSSRRANRGSIGIAGGFGMNDLTRNTEAYVDASVSADDVALSATSSDELIAVTAGAAGSKMQGTANIAGSVTVGLADETAHAWIDDGSVVTASGDVTVDAHAVVDIISVAGAVAIGGKFGVGAALDFGVITTDVQAWVGDADVNAGDDFALRASANESILSIAASLVATNTVGLSGV